MKTTQITDSLKVVEVTKTYASFQKNATTSDPVYLFQLPPKSALLSLYIQINKAFSIPNSTCKLNTTGDFLRYIDLSNRKGGSEYERNFSLNPYMYSTTTSLNIYATVYSYGLGYWETHNNSLNLARHGLASCGTKYSTLAFGGGTTTEYSADGPWVVVGDLNVSRTYLGGCGNNGNAALAIGGRSQSSIALNTVELYTIGPIKQGYPGNEPGTWANNGSFPVPIRECAAIGTISDALVVGGSYTSYYSNVYRYDGTTWTLLTDKNLLTPRGGHALAGTVTNCIAAGGITAASQNTAELFNGVTWTAAPNLNFRRQYSSGAGTFANGGIIVFGGYYVYPIAPTEEFHDTLNVWEVTNPMNVVRYSGSGCGKITVGQGGALAIGGFTSLSNGDPTSEVEIYYAAAGSATVLSNLTDGEFTAIMKYIQYQ